VDHTSAWRTAACALLLLQVNAEVRFLLARLNFSDFYTRGPTGDKEQQ
jgi:hypothetical protein